MTEKQKDVAVQGVFWAAILVLAFVFTVGFTYFTKIVFAAPDNHLSSKASINKLSGSWDDAVDVLTVVTYPHQKLHEGYSFHVHYSVTTASTDDHRTGIMFKTPNTTRWGHFVLTASASDPAEVIINEGPTLADSGDGTDKLILNRNRNSAITSTMESLEDTATVGSVTTMNETEMAAVGPSAGLELDHVFVKGGSGPFAIGGVSRGTEEYLLKQDTVYLVYIQNTGANANSHTLSLDWYENTGAN